MLELLIAWVLAAMAAAWTLTGVKVFPAVPRETAAAIAVASLEKPLFAGEEGARKTAASMVGIARYESGFQQLAGDCVGLKPGTIRCGSEGTKPTSFCFMQVNLPDGAKTKEGWTAEELMQDPLKCARAAREIMRGSIKENSAQPLKQYAGDAKKGETRFSLGWKLFEQVAWPRANGS